MSVNFHEEPQFKTAGSRMKEKGLIGLMIKLGVAKTRQGANIALAVILVLSVVGTWYMISRLNDEPIIVDDEYYEEDYE